MNVHIGSSALHTSRYPTCATLRGNDLGVEWALDVVGSAFIW